MDSTRDDAYRAAASALVARQRARRLDELAVRATAALEAAGVPSLLLRGPAIATWLYDDPAERPYDDVDLMVPEADHARASQALLDLGLTRVLGDVAPSEDAPHAHTFESPAGDGDVDLHWTMKGVTRAPADVWGALSRDAGELPLGGQSVRVPAVPARLLIVALHASQHGPQGPVQLGDVERALAAAPRRAWAEAAALAHELGAQTWFAAGLRYASAGPAMLDELGFEAPPDLEVAIRAEGDVPMIRGLAELERAPGPAAKARLLAREAFPTRSFMREWSPLARRGRAGLAAAYAGRPFWLAARFVPAYRAYRRARREAA